MNRIIFTILFVSLGIILLIPVARAQQPTLFQLGGEKRPGLGAQSGTQLTLAECIAGDETKGIPAGSCSVEHIFLLANNIIRWTVGVAGAIALFMFVMGGLWMIFSGGNSGRIERGKDILIGTSLALVFILTSWLIVNFVLQGLGTTSDYSLTGATCESDPDCAGGLVCYNKRCAERCESVVRANDNDPLHEWACHTPLECGIATYQQCDGSTNCKINYCSGGQNNVCCYPK